MSSLPLPGEEQQQIARLEATIQAYEERFHETRRSEEWYRVIFEEGLGLICVHDLDGVVTAFSPAAADLLEYDAADVVGKNIQSFMPADFQPFFGDYLTRMREARIDVGTMRLLTRSGEERLWTYRNTLIETTGTAPLVLAHAQDVTALHRARNELRDARNHLEERVRDRTAELLETNRQLQQEILERKTVEAELRASRRRLEVLHELAMEATEVTRQDLTGLVVQRCAEAMTRVVAAFIRMEDGAPVVVESSGGEHGPWGAGTPADITDTYLAQLGHGDMVVSDVSGLMAFPMREAGNLVGFLAVAAGTEREWTRSEMETLREVAGFLSVALRRSGAFPAIAEAAL